MRWRLVRPQWGILALAAPSEAKIIYTHAHKVIGNNGHLAIDLNHDGRTDFTLQDFLRSPWNELYVAPQNGE